MQNACKLPYLTIGAFLKVSGDLLGLLHGCCTDVTSLASAQGPGRSLFDQPPGAPLCELRVRNVPRGLQSMSPAEGEVSADEDCILNCKECSSNAEDVPSVICTLN